MDFSNPLQLITSKEVRAEFDRYYQENVRKQEQLELDDNSDSSSEEEEENDLGDELVVNKQSDIVRRQSAMI